MHRLAVRLDADIDLLDLHRANPARYSVLLESSATQDVHGRYDLLLVADGPSWHLTREGVIEGPGASDETDFFALINRLYQQLEDFAVEPGELPPFTGGYGLLLTYELAAQVEPILQLPQAQGVLPVASAVKTPLAIARDRLNGEIWVLGDPHATALCDEVIADVHQVGQTGATWAAPIRVIEEPSEQFLDGTRRILDYLAAGDVFQVNLSRGWEAVFADPVVPADLFARLRSHNPSPFAGIFCLDGGAVVSASPERLVQVQGRDVQTRPIAGTRARRAGDDDAAVIAGLIEHSKERAEHVMLIDLERNDLGRICESGSIEVNELMVVESYRHVHHIVSNVRGNLRDGIGPGDVLRATFPGGTITGCPKVRCMQIVAELEPAGRGAYTGAMGWMSRSNGLRMDTNILIRSATVEGTSLRFRAGAGIVMDSKPESELEETRAKAKGMLAAIGAQVN